MDFELPSEITESLLVEIRTNLEGILAQTHFEAKTCVWVDKRTEDARRIIDAFFEPEWSRQVFAVFNQHGWLSLLTRRLGARLVYYIEFTGDDAYEVFATFDQQEAVNEFISCAARLFPTTPQQ